MSSRDIKKIKKRLSIIEKHLGIGSNVEYIKKHMVYIGTAYVCISCGKAQDDGMWDGKEIHLENCPSAPWKGR